MSEKKGFFEKFRSRNTKSPDSLEQDRKATEEDINFINSAARSLSKDEETNPEVQRDEEDTTIKKSGSGSTSTTRTDGLNRANDLESIKQKITSAFSAKRQQSISSTESVEISELEEEFKGIEMKMDVQNEVVRALADENDQLAADNRVLKKVVDEMRARDNRFNAQARDQNVLIAQLHIELEEKKAMFDAVQERKNKMAVETIDNNEKIRNLERELKESKRETKAAKEAVRSTNPLLDLSKFQSMRVKDSAAESEELLNLQSKNSALKEELAKVKELLQKKGVKGDQDIEQATKKMAKLQTALEDLSNEKIFMETRLKSEKETCMIRQEELETLLKKLKLELIESKGSFRSWLRIRPLQGDRPRQNIEIRGGNIVEVVDKRNQHHEFNFDRIFSPEDDNPIVFSDLSEILEAAFLGYDITVLAYGQTGSGKTYTMSAMLDMALEQIFTQLEKSYGTEYSVNGRFIEVYEEKIYDLAGERGALRPLEGPGGIWPVRDEILPAKTERIDNAASARETIERVNKNRRSGQTQKNNTSSRSHMFLSFQVQASRTEASGAIKTTRSVITFVDLAGSESMKEGNERKTETKAINSDLSALKSVLTAMSKGRKAIPFREKQLTRLLKDGFASGKVLFIQAASIGELEESIHTMDFGSLVSNVTQKQPTKNIVTKFAGAGGEDEEITTIPSKPPAAAVVSTIGKATSGARGGLSSRGTSGTRGKSPAQTTGQYSEMKR